MSELGKFYQPAEMDYSAVVPAYQEAFKEDPWNEASKCVDKQLIQRCVGGLSSTDIGKPCGTCELIPKRPAYEPDELVDRFNIIGETRPTLWYVEAFESEVALVAVCWLTSARQLLTEKYSDVPAMESWLIAQLSDQPFVYLDEIFRNKTIRSEGNLSNFQAMVTGFARSFDNTKLAFRTKQARLSGKATTTFRGNAVVFERTANGYRSDVPDRRDFVIIRDVLRGDS